MRAFLTGNASAPLIDYPQSWREVGVDKLNVHTANLSPDSNEMLVIITTSTIDPLRLIESPVRLTSPGERDVTFVPVETPAAPALDPNLGWIIPVTADTAAELAALPPGPGAHELLSLHLGIVVE